MAQTIIWRPMSEAPNYVDKVWLRHPECGILIAEGKTGDWYCPTSDDRVWQWERPCFPGDTSATETFIGWLPFDELIA